MHQQQSSHSDELLSSGKLSDNTEYNFASPFVSTNPSSLPLQKSLSPVRSDLYLPPAFLSADHHAPISISRIINPLQIFRVLLSKNRRRMVHDKFDLDLTYITERIIAMSIPGVTPLLSMVCNPYSQVKNFLDSYHPSSYKVYNLCIEYPYKGEELFEGRYTYLPSEDMQPPSLHNMYKFCIDAHQWLKQDSNNIVVVHCKGGKGRTGCMICALLVYLAVIQKGEYLEFIDPEQALSHFATLRTVDMQGITRASQKNYVRRFGGIVNELKLGIFEMAHPIRLLMVKIEGLDEDLQRSGKLLVKVSFRTHGKEISEKVARAQIVHKNSGETKQELIFNNQNYRVWYENQVIVLDFAPIFESMQEQWVVGGDVKISVKMFRPRTKTLFYSWFSTMMVPEEGIAIANFGALDKPYKYMLSNRENIKIELQYKKLETIPLENYNFLQNSNEQVDGSMLQLQQADTENLSDALEQTINKLHQKQEQFHKSINKIKSTQNFMQNGPFDEDEFEDDEEEEEEEEEEIISTQNNLLKSEDQKDLIQF